MKRTFWERILEKIHCRSCAMCLATVMIVAGIYMCVEGIVQDGAIDLSTSLIKGKIQTGSLGLLVMFLGVIIICTVVLITMKCAGFGEKRIEIQVCGKTLVCTNLEPEQISELVAIFDKKTDDT